LTGQVETLLLIFNGLVIGFLVAAPVGPVGLLCIRRSIIDGRLAGFVTGLGAAVADALMASIAAFGVSTILNFLTGHKSSFQLIGGIVLLVMGVAAMRAQPKMERNTSPLHAPNLTGAFFSTIALTLANPVTIISLLGIFAAFGVSVRTDGWIDSSWLVLGVFLGSTAWWAILSAFAGWFGRKLNTHLLRTINIGTGLVLIGFGVYQLGSLLVRLH
jgi:threonine/homoserine/homoserine lactone efflux protein